MDELTIIRNTEKNLTESQQFELTKEPKQQSKEIILECEHIHKNFQGIEVLKDISFKVHKGEFISIVGPSGCGKTTILKIIKGLLSPDSGQVIYNRKSLKSSQNIGIIYQGSNLLPWRTVEDNIRLPLEIHPQIGKDVSKKIKSVIKLTGLNGSENKYPHQLSGGMKQLAAIAKALVDEDKIILMDEPFASLDPTTREEMAKKLYYLWKNTNTTIIFVTHFIDEAVFLSDKIIVLSPLPCKIQYITQTSSFNGGTYNSFKYPISKTINQLMNPKDRTDPVKIHQPPTKQTNGSLLHGKLGYIFSPILAGLIILLWKLIISLTSYPEFILPTPEAVGNRFLEALNYNHLLMHTGVTLTESVIGFLLGFTAALLVGYVLAKIPFLEKIFYPYITASQTTPIIAIAPLVALWFGFGMSSKIFISALIVFFPVLLTTIAGIREISGTMGEIMQGLGANRFQTLIKLEFPGTMPYLFATIKVGITLSLVGAVVGEFVSSNKGLGYLVVASKGILDTPLLFVTIITLALVGIFLYSIVIIMEKVVFRSKTNYA